MKKIMMGFTLGAIIFSGITAYALTKLKAEEVSYNDKTVKDAIDELYKRTLTSGNCVQGYFQLDNDASGPVGNKILDFAPSTFLLIYYDKNLPAGGANWNGGIAYYNKDYFEDYVFWPNLYYDGKTISSLNTLEANFTIDNNLILKNTGSAWINANLFYMACK